MINDKIQCINCLLYFHTLKDYNLHILNSNKTNCSLGYNLVLDKGKKFKSIRCLDCDLIFNTLKDFSMHKDFNCKKINSKGFKVNYVNDMNLISKSEQTTLIKLLNKNNYQEIEVYIKLLLAKYESSYLFHGIDFTTR